MLRGAALALGLAACAIAPAEQPNAYADYLAGRIANLRADHDAAAERYGTALARAPRDDVLLNGALTASLATGDSERARQLARAAPRTGAPAYAHLVRACEALTARRWRQADQELAGVEGAAAEELIGRMLQVWALTASGRIGEVEVDLAPLAAIRPYGSLFATQQAMALDYVGREDEALAAYAMAEQGGLWLPAGVERHADLLVRRGARDEALALLGREANHANPALAAARARIEAGAPASLLLSPARGAAISLYGLSSIFLQESDSTSGLAALTLALMLDPGFDDARLAFAQAQTALGHAEPARAARAAIAPTSPYALSASIMESWALLDSGEIDAALALARENAASGDARARRALADMFRSLDRFAEAELIYSELLTAQPNEWRFHFARAAAREELGRWPEAEADLQAALALSPAQPDVLNYLGYSWVDRGMHLQEGLAMIQRAVALRPTSGAIIDSLGWAHYRLGDYAQALDYLERAVELDPSESTLNDHLGDVYWRLGRRIEARFQWRRALTLAPDAPALIEAKMESGLPAEPAIRSAAR